jgi:hypothetical protein
MTYDEIRDLVSENNGVTTLNMGDLRDAHGAGKLGVHVRANISKELRRRGLGHAPNELPIYQHEPVRVWLMGTPAGDLIESVLNVSPEADRVIRNAVEADASDVLDKVRELVCA